MTGIHPFWRTSPAMYMSLRTHRIDLPEQVERLEAGKSYWTFFEDSGRKQGRLLALGSKISKACSAPIAIQLPCGQFRITGKVKYVFDLDGILSRYAGRQDDCKSSQLIDINKSKIWETWALLNLYPENIDQIIESGTRIAELEKKISENSRRFNDELFSRDGQIRKAEQDMQRMDRQFRRR